MVGTVEAPVLVEPQVERVHRGHGGVDVVLERLLDTAGERRQHEHRLEVLAVQHLHPRVAVLVLGMVGQPVDLHQRGRVDTLGDLAAEQQIQTARLDDRVERRVRDEVVDHAAHDGEGPLALGEHLHAAALELLGQVPGERVDRSRSSGCRRRSPGSPASFARSCSGRSQARLSGGKLGCRFSKKAVMPSMKSGRSIDSCMSFSARALVSTTVAHGVVVDLLLDHRQRTRRTVAPRCPRRRPARSASARRAARPP